MKSVYRFYRKTIENNLFATANVWGKFVTLLSNTAEANILLSIENEEFEELPAGIGVHLSEQEKFTELKFKNVSGAVCTIEFAVSAGEVIDNRMVMSGDLNVTDVANAITTPLPIVALDKNNSINNDPAVDKGGGLVGIPVTNQPFATGEILTIIGTTNYDAIDHIVDATSSANEVVITATYIAETFSTTDKIGLTTPRSIDADNTQKQIIVQNQGVYDIWFGDINIDAITKRGTMIASNDVAAISTTTKIYFMSDEAGISGCILSFNRLQKT